MSEPTREQVGMLESVLQSMRRLTDTMNMFASRMDSLEKRIEALEPVVERPEDE